MNKLFKTLTTIALTSAFAFSGMLLASTTVFAADSPMSLNVTNSGNVHLRGTVNAVSGANVSVNTWGGTWVVNTAGATIPSGLAEVKVGDHVTVNGKITNGMNVQAKLLVDHTKPTTPNNQTITKTISGIISNVNSTAGTLTLTTTAGNVNIATDTSTTVHIGGNTSTFANLSNGLTVTVSGPFNATTNTITAATIKSPASPISWDWRWTNKLHEKFNGIFKLFAKVGNR